MLAKTKAVAIQGLNVYGVDVEVDINRGLPNFTIVGLGDTAIQEARERVKSAIKNSNFTFPQQKIVVNLAPADLKKSGPVFDLAISIGILITIGVLPFKLKLAKSLFVGELALSGDLRGINGILLITIWAKEQGYKEIFVPQVNVKEAAVIAGINVYGVSNLLAVVDHLNGEKLLQPHDLVLWQKIIPVQNYLHNFNDIKGQNQAKRALEIAAAGGHNILMSGPPGSGKTLLAKSFPSILPDITFLEAIEVTKIYSVSGLLDKKQSLLTVRPFRCVHHTASSVAIVGGGRNPKPGEISLAHRGVLFLDEFVEFPKNVIEVLRQPLEDGVINISRAEGTMTFPAKFQLVAAMNPHPSEYDENYTYNNNSVNKYNQKISGPILDRIDLFIKVPAVPFEKLKTMQLGESSAEIKVRVDQARAVQTKRFIHSKIMINSEMTNSQIKKYCVLNEDSEFLLKQAMYKFDISARAYYRILKVARTIADLEDSKGIKTTHIAEALQYRKQI